MVEFLFIRELNAPLLTLPVANAGAEFDVPKTEFEFAEAPKIEGVDTDDGPKALWLPNAPLDEDEDANGEDEEEGKAEEEAPVVEPTTLLCLTA